MRPNNACALVPTDFSAVTVALGRLICICEVIAFDIVDPIRIEPVILGPNSVLVWLCLLLLPIMLLLLNRAFTLWDELMPIATTNIARAMTVTVTAHFMLRCVSPILYI